MAENGEQFEEFSPGQFGICFILCDHNPKCPYYSCNIFGKDITPAHVHSDFLCLSINSVYGTAAFFPRMLSDLLSDTHAIPYEACLIQSFVIFSYTANEFTTLLLMAFDRFVAISKPLQYHNIITLRFLTVLIFIHWIFPMLCLAISGLFTARLTMCDNKLWKVYCHNYEIVKLSCANTISNIIWGFFILIITAVIPLCLILYSYVKILIICQRSSSQFRSKAYQTCIPHIVVLLNFSIAIISEITLSRIVNLKMPIWLSVILSQEFLVVPPILNPLLYALNFTDIRKKIICLIKGSFFGFCIGEYWMFGGHKEWSELDMH
ncbi:olfactory receptor 51I2-like [Misgurnus anguillicaudatus]|uniref:olfactory receptor 51I2-like n=1 Tax=Misgurnus anguillicaudatus TaxID=75329 RepID=UPI003CCFBD1C